jgi:hypothetical protein
MTRIAKRDVNEALDRAAQNILRSAGADPVTTRAELKRTLGGLEGTEKALTDRFFRFADHRGKKDGRVSHAELRRTLAYAKEKLIAAYDVNGNGLSKGEVARMSDLGKLAVQLAAETRGVAPARPGPGPGTLGERIADAAQGVYFISETDSNPTYVEAKLPRGAQVDGKTVFKAFELEIFQAMEFEEGPANLDGWTFEVQHRGFLEDVIRGYKDPRLDAMYHDSAAGFARIKELLDAHLTDVIAVKVGYQDDRDPTKLAQDAGSYWYLVVGKTGDSKLAGVRFESVET